MNATQLEIIIESDMALTTVRHELERMVEQRMVAIKSLLREKTAEREQLDLAAAQLAIELRALEAAAELVTKEIGDERKPPWAE